MINKNAVTTAARKAGSQDDKVMALFNIEPGIKATASQVFYGGIRHGYWTEHTPLTSVRRSMSCLAKAGRLVKLSETRAGIYGQPEYCYSLPVNAE